jgi:A/G-specific adenine glycosylase
VNHITALEKFRRRLLAWYREHRRDLPWRRSRDPYRIWISEVMLQQTRAAAVIPYYERFLERFPDAAALARAPEQELLAAWAGLGYYSRARNLQKAALRIEQQGGFPREHAAIRELAGIGEYTAAAIASIAFNLPHAVLDGNVARVLSRVTAEPGDIAAQATRARLHATALALLPTRRPGEFNQAMMELGATLCLPRKPRCLLCPVADACEARRAGRQEEFPIKRGKGAATQVARDLLVIAKKDRVLLWQRPASSRRLAGFWELPERDQLPAAKIESNRGEFRHIIVNTSYRFQVLEAAISRTPQGFYWKATKILQEMPLSTTARKALAVFNRLGDKDFLETQS